MYLKRIRPYQYKKHEPLIVRRPLTGQGKSFIAGDVIEDHEFFSNTRIIKAMISNGRLTQDLTGDRETIDFLLNAKKEVKNQEKIPQEIHIEPEPEVTTVIDDEPVISSSVSNKKTTNKRTASITKKTPVRRGRKKKVADATINPLQEISDIEL